MPVLKTYCAFIVLIGILNGLFIEEAQATHNRAGEITYVQIDDFTIRATIVTFTRTSSIDADRDSLTLIWGDGDSSVVQRTLALEFPNDIKRNEYVAEHTYPTRGTFKLSVTDPNRIAGILNVDFPNSVNIRFYIETTLTLLEARFQGQNSSVILLQPPIDFACAGQPYTYNPNAFDVDGDSLTYELVTPFSEEGVEVPNYELPDRVRPGPDNQIFLDPNTGSFSWDTPQALGEYNITYRINEFRNGELINSIIRDMQILVRACPDNNRTPEIEVAREICVIAGDLLEIEVLTTDQDSFEILTLTASGGPFELGRVSFDVDDARPNSSLRGVIRWQTDCSDATAEFYQIVVRSTDEVTRPETALAKLETIRVKVTAPAPTGLEATAENAAVSISWDNPYRCDTLSTFRGFSVWRREGSQNFQIDTCQGGLDGSGYERIIFLANEEVDDRYFARDVEIEPNTIYCYRVVAEFADITAAGNPFSPHQSLASDEVCIRSSGESPLLTNVSVLDTDDQNGAILVRWLNPTSQAIDTAILVGPYEIEVLGSPGLAGSNLSSLEARAFSTGDFAQIDFNTLNVQGLNTTSQGYSYQVTFSSGTDDDLFTAPSEIASSVFLSGAPIDEGVVLTWESLVPWNNFNYDIYRVNETGGLELVDSTAETMIRFLGLENGVEECYLIESFGKYGFQNETEPLINRSNETCVTPMDNSAPCPPTVEVSTVCDQSQLPIEDILENRIEWTFNSLTCEAASDLESFNVFFAETEEAPLQLIESVMADETLTIHQLEDNIAGCYAISAVDFSGNEGPMSDRVCVDNCPTYVLPNAFTPNNDNSNDLFVPRVNRFIDRIDFEVFNRWGNLVFATSDPAINWNGQNISNEDLKEGTYFYTCAVFERRVEGVVEGAKLSGTIQLIR